MKQTNSDICCCFLSFPVNLTSSFPPSSQIFDTQRRRCHQGHQAADHESPRCSGELVKGDDDDDDDDTVVTASRDTNCNKEESLSAESGTFSSLLDGSGALLTVKPRVSVFGTRWAHCWLQACLWDRLNTSVLRSHPTILFH